MKALIIEDEVNSALVLQNMLAEFCPGVSCLGICANVTEGINAIRDLQPDLIFLDIMLQQETGFSLVEQLPAPKPQIIFTTAYEKHSIQAIRLAALDYLLKPINLKELQAAIGRAHQNLDRYGIAKLNDLISQSGNAHAAISRLAIPTLDGHEFVAVDDIIRIEASGSYCKVLMTGETEILVSRQLKEYEQLLGHNGFTRVHHSHLVNNKHIRRYIKGSGGYLLMSDNRTVDVSQRKKEDLLKVLGIH